MLAHYGLETSSYIGYLEINKGVEIAFYQVIDYPAIEIKKEDPVFIICSFHH